MELNSSSANRSQQGVGTIKMTIEGTSAGFAERLRAIVKRRIEERSGARLLDRGQEGELTIACSIQTGVGSEGFRIDGGPGNEIRIIGNDIRGLLYGAGKFLHSSLYTQDGLVPSTWRGSSQPRGSVRGMYLASHFFNWYQVAPEAEIREYLEDLALWGVNTIALVFPIVNLYGWEDAETDNVFVQLHKAYRTAKELGLDIGLTVAPNQDFKLPRAAFAALPNPDPLGRRGNHGNNICPSIPGAQEYILENMREAFHRLKEVELDYLCVWPYDEGGCACQACSPWGANGYVRISRAVIETAGSVFPKLKVILSTWMFDTPYEGEWEGLAEVLREQNGWADYILADAHEDFPAYPLEQEVPGGLPLLNFPEISMWGLFPWGGYGATPLPKRFEALWNQVKHKVTGGIPYSEGIYEDINKVVISMFYWDADYTAEEILEQYIAYEFSHEVVSDVMKLIRFIENNQVTVAYGGWAAVEDAEEAYRLANRVDALLPQRAKSSWRWRILYIRALLDKIRYAAVPEGKWPWPQQQNWGPLLKGNLQAEEAMKELIQIYHCMIEDDGTYVQHSWVRPPV
ncbi:hypothetical protein [Paenibacillus contaminans]|uniref:Beta-hexosaminidase bacterial type N-terminal domain-containing protein n=1 Tax=Paenibacillus contaminans TaxID=450362 RepID=A0A329M9N1_9BACL|nr:hypothetical protein [Paenibacillus contaminans]RAV16691.1 hypothetical protein DQG23_28035 [Paenibacillus contaminans]